MEAEKTVRAGSVDFIKKTDPGEMVKGKESYEVDIIGDLPLEISLDILILLEPKDLITCSAVNRLWRERVNSDRLWKRFCLDRHWYEEAIHKIELFHSFMDPVWKDDPALELVTTCKWRKVYNLNQGLTRNWTNEKYIKYTLSATESPVFCFDCDGITAVTGHENGNLIVWCVKSVPYKVQVFESILPDFPVVSVRTTTSYILAVQKKLLQIYKYNDGYKFLDAKSFELGDENIEIFQKLPRVGIGFGRWYKECLRFNDVYSFQTLYFVPLENLLYATCSESYLIYVWNLSDGKKDSVIMTDKQEIKSMKAFGDRLYVTIIDKGIEAISLLEYKPTIRILKKLITAENMRKISVSETFLLGIPETGEYEQDRFRMIKLKVWLRRSSRLIGQREVCCCPITAIVSELNKVIYSQYADVTVWDPIKDVTLITFTTGGNVGFMRIGYSNFLIVFINSSIYIWDWRHGHRLYRLYSSLEWTGDYKSLLWSSNTVIIAGGVKNQLEMIVFL